MNSETEGFWELSQLASRRETDRQKGYIGVLPLSKSTIMRMVKRGEFPKPFLFHQSNVWRKEDVRAWMDEQEANGRLSLESSAEFLQRLARAKERRQ